MLAARMGEPTEGADTYRSVRTGHRGLRTAVIVELDLATVLVRVTVSADTTFQGSHFSQQLRIPSHVKRFRDRLCQLDSRVGPHRVGPVELDLVR